MKQATIKNSSIKAQLNYRLREGLFILSVAGCLFLLLSLMTYHRTDPGWSRVGETTLIANIGGRVGAWFSDILLYIFGYMAYLFPLTLSYIAWMVFLHEKKEVKPTSHFSGGNWLGFLLTLIATDGLISLNFNTVTPHLPFYPGGILGHVAGLGLATIFNHWGTTLLLLALLLSGITFFTGFSWLKVLDWTGKQALKLLLNLKTYCVDLLKRKAEPALSLHKEPVLTPRPPATTKERKSSNPAASVEAAEIPKPTIKIQRLKEKKTLSLGEHQRLESLPPLDLLDLPEPTVAQSYSHTTLEEMSREVEIKLRDFGVEVQVVAVHPGPVITRFELQLAPGVKVNKISNLNKDLARSLSVISVRIVDVIPGKSVVGLELPNTEREIVRLSEVLTSQQYDQARSPLSLALGKDIAGHPVVVDLAKMPHLLVAGTTGSGKSVGLNGMLLSMIYKASPDEVRLIMIDPKMLELSVYDGIPHLLTPVVTDMKQAANALRWCIAEMDRRYRLMAHLGVRNLAGFNHKVKEAIKDNNPIPHPFIMPVEGVIAAQTLEPLPYVVVIIDEFADMMLVVGKKVEDLIARLAQKARAAGIHLILATQRPSVDVITGLIKANIPTRIAFQVSSKIDSRTILDQQGAEQLLGYGDMLYLAPGAGIPVRIHGAFVADHEVHKVVNFLKAQGAPDYLEEILEDNSDGSPTELGIEENQELDPLYDQAVRIVTETRRASISNVQRRLKIGYNRAARILEEMEHAGIVSSMQANGNREVLAAPPPTVDENF